MIYIINHKFRYVNLETVAVPIHLLRMSVGLTIFSTDSTTPVNKLKVSTTREVKNKSEVKFLKKMGGGCNPKKPNPYPRKGQTGIGFFWVFLGFLNIAILAEKYAYFYFPFKSFELPQYIFVQSMTPLNIGLHGNT